MKKTIRYMPVLLALLLAASLTAAQETAGTDSTSGPEGYLPQTTCPVMGGAIDSTIYADYQGQRVYFCCAMCVDKFMEHPEASFRKAAEQGVMYQNIQEECPVCGGPIDSAYFRYHMGRGLFFSSEECAEAFDRDPGKYLEKMEGGEEKGHDHGDGGHGHDHEGHRH